MHTDIVGSSSLFPCQLLHDGPCPRRPDLYARNRDEKIWRPCRFTGDRPARNLFRAYAPLWSVRAMERITCPNDGAAVERLIIGTAVRWMPDERNSH